jgi:hypothetical protein
MINRSSDIEVSQLDGFEQVASIIADRPLYHFSVVHTFRFFRHREDYLGDPWSDIELVMEEFNPPRAQIGISFHRVADVTFSGFAQIMGLYFKSIKERGWERLRFEVGDYEEGKIHLFCHQVSFFDIGNNS